MLPVRRRRFLVGVEDDRDGKQDDRASITRPATPDLDRRPTRVILYSGNLRYCRYLVLAQSLNDMAYPRTVTGTQAVNQDRFVTVYQNRASH